MTITFLYWSIPIILTFHELEEWNILKWYKRHFIDPPPSDNLAVRTWILFCSFIGYLWTYLSILMPNNHVTAFFMGLLILITVQNAIQHIYWQFLFHAYSPGIIFSTIGLVTGVYVIYKETNEGYLPLWVDFILLIALIPTTIQTIRAKNTMTKSVQNVHHFGIKLAYWVWIK
jgi:hypothetical protein